MQRRAEKGRVRLGKKKLIPPKIIFKIIRQFSFSNFASSFTAIRHNSFVNFQLKQYIFWTKVAYQRENIQIFECPG